MLRIFRPNRDRELTFELAVLVFGLFVAAAILGSAIYFLEYKGSIRRYIEGSPKQTVETVISRVVAAPLDEHRVVGVPTTYVRIGSVDYEAETVSPDVYSRARPGIPIRATYVVGKSGQLHVLQVNPLGEHYPKMIIDRP